MTTDPGAQATPVCIHCGKQAVMRLRCAKRDSEYPHSGPVCPHCATFEARIIDQMGGVPLGRYLQGAPQ